MKIAFLMQCHKNPSQINKLLKVLEHPAVDVFIHIDAKFQNIREKINTKDGVYILSSDKCIDVQWAQFSQVQATLNLIEEANRVGRYSHYWLISGQDYPIYSVKEIVDFMEKHEEDNFIDCNTIKKFEKRNDIYFSEKFIGRKVWQKIIKNIWVYGTGGVESYFPCNEKTYAG